MGNCHNFFLLRIRDQQAIRTMSQELDLTDELAQRFNSMPDPSEAGCSRFIYVHRAESQHIAGEGLLRVDKAESLLYSTNPNISEWRDTVVKHDPDPWRLLRTFSALSQTEQDTILKKKASL